MIVNEGLLKTLKKNERVDCINAVTKYGRDQIRDAIIGVFDRQNREEYMMLKEDIVFRENYFKLLTFYLLSEEKKEKYSKIGDQLVKVRVPKKPLPKGYYDNLMKLKDEIRTAFVPVCSEQLARAC